jgi:predicted heme/steroid binding protein/uncharacterized membrane protein
MTRRIVKLSSFYLLAVSVLFPVGVFATEEYAEKTGQSCEVCHVDPGGGPALTPEGEAFRRGLEPTGVFGPFASLRRVIRGAVHYVHLLAAVFWFGTIMYVHFVLRPAYAARGLPKAEVRIGLGGIVVMAVTGTILTLMRISSWDMLLHTRFGVLLVVKICLFALMVALAMTAVFIVGPRLARKPQPLGDPDKHTLTLDELARFDGKAGRPAYAAYRQKVYDMSASRVWEDGVHFGRHQAGLDLSDVLEQSPHGEEKMVSVPCVGDLVDAEKRQPTSQRAFYMLAYLNLGIVFVILFVVSLWRW